MTSETRYINTDLDLLCDDDLSPLARHFDEHAHLLHCQADDEGGWMLTAEGPGSGFGNFEVDLDGLLRAAEDLDAAGRALWDRCTKRDVNIGFECSTTWAHRTTLPPSIVARAAKLGCSITVTLYPADRPAETGASANPT